MYIYICNKYLVVLIIDKSYKNLDKQKRSTLKQSKSMIRMILSSQMVAISDIDSERLDELLDFKQNDGSYDLTRLHYILKQEQGIVLNQMDVHDFLSGKLQQDDDRYKAIDDGLRNFTEAQKRIKQRRELQMSKERQL